jgi:hypothetical protein
MGSALPARYSAAPALAWALVWWKQLNTFTIKTFIHNTYSEISVIRVLQHKAIRMQQR